jgi:hypothetical protein
VLGEPKMAGPCAGVVADMKAVAPKMDFVQTMSITTPQAEPFPILDVQAPLFEKDAQNGFPIRSERCRLGNAGKDAP